MKKVRYFQIKNWSDVVSIYEECSGRWLAENSNLCPKAITQEQYEIFMAGYDRGYHDGTMGE